MNGTATVALLDKALREAALRAYVESGDAGRDVSRAFAEYRKQFPAD